MEKQSFISGRQVVVILLLTRLPYSTAFISSLHAGNSIQDILLAVPINFLLNFLLAAPILLLMSRYPGKDMLEIADQIGGRGLTVVLGIVYLAGFLCVAVLPIDYFQNFYTNSIIPESRFFGIVIPLLLVCVYAAVRGVEGLARLGMLVLIAYLIDVLFIVGTVIPSVHLEYLLPQLYNGPGVLEKAVLIGANSSFQIVLLSFLAPFLRSHEKPARLFARWNIIAAIVLLYLQFMVVTVLGTFGTEQVFPLYTLSRRSGLGVFDRLEAAELIPWIMETVFEIAVFIYIAYTCLTRMGLNKYRRTVTFVIGAVLLGAGRVTYRRLMQTRYIGDNPWVTAGMILTVLVIPLGLLLADTVRRKAGQKT